MNRLDPTFARLAAVRRKALVGFLTAGVPDFYRSLGILSAAAAAGLDVLELGVPFSDPTADGPVIQQASARALASGMSLARVFDLLKALRRDAPDLPVVLFSYYNPIFRYGARKFHDDDVAAGADGVLVRLGTGFGHDELRVFDSAVFKHGCYLVTCRRERVYVR